MIHQTFAHCAACGVEASPSAITHPENHLRFCDEECAAAWADQPASNWYAVSITPGGLALRHLRHKAIRRSPDARHAKMIPVGEQGFAAKQILERHGYQPFIPVESIWIRNDAFRTGRKRRVKRAIIPNLAFLHLAEPVNWMHLLSVPMVSGVFGLAGAPYRFRPRDIARLIAMSEDMRMPDYYKPMPTRRVFDVGDMVADLKGRFDTPLKVVSIAGNTAKVLGRLFGADIVMQAETAHLAKWE